MIILQQKKGVQSSQECIWLDGKFQDVRTELVTIKPELVFDPPVSPEAKAKLDEAVKLIAGGGEQDSGKALEILQTLVEKEPGYLSARYYYGVALASIDRFEEAEKMFREVLRERPDHLFSAASLLMMLTREGRLDEADEFVKSYRQPKEVEMDHWILWSFALLGLNVKRGRLDYAKRIKALVEQLSPGHPWLEREEYRVE